MTRALSDESRTRRDDRFLHPPLLEVAGALRRSGLIDIARPLMHAVADGHGVTVYLSKVLGPSSMLLLDWVLVFARSLPAKVWES